MSECYICLEPCNNTSKCLCNELYVHDKCLLQNILRSNSNQCSICKNEYKNVTIKYTNICVCQNRIYIAILIMTSVGSVILYGSGLFLVIKYLDKTNYKENLLLVISGSILMFLGIINMFIYINTYKYIKNNNIALCKLKKKKIVIRNDIIV